MKEHPLDTCTCGDYRRDHDRNGICRLCRAFNPSFVDKCQRFTLAHEATVADIEHDRTGRSS